MLVAYFNYPVARICVHSNPNCGYARRRNKPGRRLYRIDRDNVDRQLDSLANGTYHFTAKAGFNDLWLEIVMNSKDAEIEVLSKVQLIFERRHSPFRGAQEKVHC